MSIIQQTWKRIQQKHGYSGTADFLYAISREVRDRNTPQGAIDVTKSIAAEIDIDQTFARELGKYLARVYYVVNDLNASKPVKTSVSSADRQLIRILANPFLIDVIFRKRPAEFAVLFNMCCLNQMILGKVPGLTPEPKWHSWAMTTLNKWLNDFPALAKPALIEICKSANALGRSECQSYCRLKDVNCDANAMTYCSQNKDQPFCACINSKSPPQYNPRCFDKKCLNHGYVTAGQWSQECPNIVDCRTIIDLQTALGNNLASVDVEQNCGNQEYVPPPSTSASTPPSAPMAAPMPNNTSSTNWIVILLFILITLVSVIGVIIYFKGISIGGYEI